MKVNQMASLPSLVVAGGSHMEAIFRGGQLMGTNIAQFSFFSPQYQPGVLFDGGHFIYNQKLLDELSEYITKIRPDIVIAAIGNSNDFEIGALKMPVPFDFISPSENQVDVPSVGQLIPYSLLFEHFVRVQRLAMDFIMVVRTFFDGPIVVPSTPPPVSSQSRLASFVPPSWKGDLTQNGLNSAAFRKRLWEVNVRALEQEAVNAGAIYISAPVGCFDREGLICEQFSADAFHGNSLYGKLVIDQIVTLSIESGVV